MAEQSAGLDFLGHKKTAEGNIGGRTNGSIEPFNNGCLGHQGQRFSCG